MTTEINNAQDIIDSRDIIARIGDLESDLDVLEDWEAEELKALQNFAEEASRYTDDWIYGAALIRDSYFEEYAQDLAEDCGMISSDTSWPNTYIDWEQAARALQVDYRSIDFDGVTYWIR